MNYSLAETADEALGNAEQAFLHGNLSAADLLCHYVLASYPDHPRALGIRSLLASRLGLAENGSTWLQSGAHPNVPRFLLIKAWGQGFWSDMCHVMASLLVAEITDRIPVVQWGGNSLFHCGGGGGGDAFRHYWDPVSRSDLEDVVSAASSGVFPAKWRADNLEQNDFEKWAGPCSRLGAIHFLNRPEPVAVTDFYASLVDVAPWIPTGHAMHGAPLDEIYRYVADLYLRPAQAVRQRVEAFRAEYLAGHDVLGVHIRGSDKETEFHALELLNRQYFDLLDAESPLTKFFVLTDDARWLAALRQRYGDRIIYTPSQRTTSLTGVHNLPDVDRLALGMEVMTDTHLALSCDRFVGNGRSNLSNIVFLLKPWAPDACRTFEPPTLFWRNAYIHLPQGGGVWGFGAP